MQFPKTNNADFLSAKCDELGKRHKSLSLRGKTGEEQLVHVTCGGAGREYAAFSGVAEKDQYLQRLQSNDVVHDPDFRHGFSSTTLHTFTINLHLHNTRLILLQ